MSATIPAVHCKTCDELYERKTGAFFITANRNSMLIRLPPSGDIFSVRLTQGDPDHPSWTLTGPDDKPTLAPSLVIKGWHGWLRAGQLVTI